jgi:hypothetical protein
MLASMLLGLFSITAKELGKQIGMSSLSYGTNKVWILLVGESNAAQFNQVNQRLDEVLGELSRVRSSISEVKTQIDGFRADVKTDNVNQYVNKIESLYDQYMAALDSLAEAVKDGASGKAGAKAARERLTQLGTLVANSVFDNVKQIDSLLAGAGNPLFSIIHKDNITRDFLSYFCAMKSVFVRYYLVQTKAIFVMSLVAEDRTAKFVEGKKLVQKVEKMLQEQEQFLLTLIPDSVVKLVEAITAAPDSTPVSFRSAVAGRGLGFGSLQYGNIMTLVTKRIEEWRLEPMQPLTMNPKGEYSFRLRNVRSGRVLILSGSQYGAVADDDKVGRNGWKIRCASDGRFWLEFIGNYYKEAFNNDRLATRNSGSSKDNELFYSKNHDNSDAYQQFYIEPYVTAFRGADSLISHERLIPESYIESANRSHRLYYRESGNVEIVKMPEGATIWTANTGSSEPGWLIMQNDGNLVAYTTQGKPYWSSGVGCGPKELHVYQHSVLRLHDDGTVDIRLPDQQPFWKN